MELQRQTGMTGKGKAPSVAHTTAQDVSVMHEHGDDALEVVLGGQAQSAGSSTGRKQQRIPLKDGLAVCPSLFDQSTASLAAISDMWQHSREQFDLVPDEHTCKVLEQFSGNKKFQAAASAAARSKSVINALIAVPEVSDLITDHTPLIQDASDTAPYSSGDHPRIEDVDDGTTQLARLAQDMRRIVQNGKEMLRLAKRVIARLGVLCKAVYDNVKAFGENVIGELSEMWGEFWSALLSAVLWILGSSLVRTRRVASVRSQE